jgi:hypothetical protein
VSEDEKKRRLDELKPVPPDHPMFHGGVSFVFRSELPLKPEDAPESEDED